MYPGPVAVKTNEESTSVLTVVPVLAFTAVAASSAGGGAVP